MTSSTKKLYYTDLVCQPNQNLHQADLDQAVQQDVPLELEHAHHAETPTHQYILFLGVWGCEHTRKISAAEYRHLSSQGPATVCQASRGTWAERVRLFLAAFLLVAAFLGMPLTLQSLRQRVCRPLIAWIHI